MIQIFKKYWLLFLIGLILRLVLAAITFHPDAKTPALASAVVLRDGQLNFYQESKKLAPREILDDLPLSYFISLPIHAASRFLVDPNLEASYFQNPSVVFGNLSGWLYMLYTKLPMIIFDLLLAGLLALCVDESKQKKVLKIWLFNPIALWVIAVGQADIFIAFFILLAYLLVKKGKLDWAALSLGFGGAIKSVPFLLLPFLLGLADNWKDRFKLLLISLIPYLVTVFPYISSSDFRHNALFAPQLDKVLYAKLLLSGGEAVFIVPVILIILYFIFFQKKRKEEDFLKFIITALLLILSFTHFHIQWIIWVVPLLVLWLIDNQKPIINLAILGLSVSLIIMLFMFDASLQIKLFDPIMPSLDSFRGFAEILNSDQVFFFRSLAATLFIGSTTYLIYNLHKKYD